MDGHDYGLLCDHSSGDHSVQRECTEGGEPGILYCIILIFM